MLLAMIWSAGWAAIGDNFKLVTDAKDLKAGDKIIIGSKASKVVLGADNGSKSHKRLPVSATFSSDGVVAWQEGFDVITLEGTASAWYLHSQAGYLYAGGKKTDLKTASDLASVTNNAAIITITNNVASISFTTSESGRYIFYNTTSKVFGHYKKDNTTTSQIYKLVDSGDTKTATTLSFNTEEKEFSVEKTCEASFTAPTATVKDVDGKVVEGAKITYASSNSNIASVGENGKVTFGSEIGTATITASYAGDDTYKPAESISYTIKYSKIPTVMVWSQSSVSVNLGEENTFTAPTLTFTAHDENILEGKTIQYNSSDETVAIIDETGYVLPMEKAGSTTITATFAGDDTYEAASAEYTLNVIDPNKTDVTFDFTKPEDCGSVKPALNGKKELSDGDVLVSGGVSLTNTKGGSLSTRFKDEKGSVTFRVYTGAILTVNAPAGFAINRIDFTDDNDHTVDRFKFSTGKLDNKTWTGLAKNLTMTVDKNQVFLENMTVNLVKLVELDENSESNTIEAKTGVNVTLKRTMVANEWNTICLPFAVTEDKATAAFGDDVKIVELDEYAIVDRNVLSFKASKEIAAATPYLIKPSTVADEYTFENVDITDKAAGYSMTKNADVAFKGIYNTVDITSDVVDAKFGDTYYAAFLGADNKIYKAKANGNKTKGFRAYFAIPKSASASALRVVIDGTATSIKNIDSEVVESNAPVYNLQGQRVDGNNLTPGIYVKAGKKFVVK